MAIQYLAQAFGAVMTPMNLGILFVSTFAGLIMGMLPGLSATMAVALLTGLTYSLSSTDLLILCLCRLLVPDLAVAVLQLLQVGDAPRFEIDHALVLFGQI